MLWTVSSYGIYNQALEMCLTWRRQLRESHAECIGPIQLQA